MGADNRRYDDNGDVVDGYQTPDEARENGLEWHGRPNEPTPYLTPDESRGLNVPWQPDSSPQYKQYNYDNAYAQSVQQLATRNRPNNAVESLMALMRPMNATPGSWQGTEHRLSMPQKQQLFPSQPSMQVASPDYSNILQQAQQQAGTGTTSGWNQQERDLNRRMDGVDIGMAGGNMRPPGIPATWVQQWDPLTQSFIWGPPMAGF